MIKSLDGVECAVDIYIKDACGSSAPRQRGSSEGVIKSLQQKDILMSL